MDSIKHVFITHSNLTKIIIEAIIEELNLTKDQVIILSFRNSRLANYLNIDLEKIRQEKVDLFKLSLGKRIANFFKIQHVINNVDRIINIKDDFVLYTPQLVNPYFQIIASHKRCKKIHFILIEYPQNSFMT